MRDKDADGLLDELRWLEQSLHRQELRRNPEDLKQLLSEDFFEFGRSGRVFDNLDTMIAELVAEPTEREGEPVESRDFRLTMLAEDLALLTYRSTRQSQKCPCATLRSSLWHFLNGRWQLRFHQGTPTDP